MLDRLDTMINKEFCTILQLVTRLLYTIKNIHGQIKEIKKYLSIFYDLLIDSIIFEMDD